MKYICKSVVRSTQAFKNQNDFLKCKNGKNSQKFPQS